MSERSQQAQPEQELRAPTALDQQIFLLPLLELLQSAGNKAQKDRAFASLYQHTSAQLLALAMRIVRNRTDAEDVLCEVYRQAWERPHQYSAERGPVIAWLYVITRTRALDALRKLQSERAERGSEHFEASLAETYDETPNQGELLQATQDASAVHQALLTLTAAQQHMLKLAFFQDLSHVEISELTGMALGTVKSHIRRGQTALKEALERVQAGNRAHRAQAAAGDSASKPAFSLPNQSSKSSIRGES